MKKLIQHLYRYCKYKQYRQQLKNNKAVIQLQYKNFFENFINKKVEKIIVFIVPGLDSNTMQEKISGGVISIMSIASETKKLFSDTSTEVIVCTLKGETLIEKYERFQNDFKIYEYSFIEKFKSLNEIIIHVPDYLILSLNKSFNNSNYKFLKSTSFVQINLMNQNINLMPKPNEIEILKNITTNITITTAHQQYCNSYYRSYFGFPLHKLSVWISPEQYTFKSKEVKEDLLVYSPDEHPEKLAVINRLKEVKGLSLQMIKGMTYDEYKKIISRAKWSLTFGEGLDGYIIEPVFSGAIGFAVYNEDFFTEEFKGMKTFYNSYDDLYNNIVNDIKELDDNEAYKAYQKSQYDLCAAQYNSSVYKNNIAKFYKRDYTFK